MIKKVLASLMALMVCTGIALAASETPVEVSDLQVKGRIEGENIVFTLSFTANVNDRSARIPIAIGDLALYKDSRFPKNSELTREGNQFLLEFGSRGKQDVVFQFASRPVKDKYWRHTSFLIPVSNIRRLMVECDRDDLEIQFPGALKIERHKNDAGKMEVTAFLGLTTQFEVRWKPEVKQLAGETVVECRANTIATANVGALRLNTLFSYRVVQGALEKIKLELPENVNVTQVRGEDIRDWALEKTDGKHMLIVTLSRPKEGAYNLQVEGETVLSKFPCSVDLPVINPTDVIRTSGFLVVGTDSAIKLLVDRTFGLTQIDQSAFPAAQLNSKVEPRTVPRRSSFAYQYANMPYTVTLQADDIVPQYSIDDRLVLSLKDNDLVFSASVEADVRDAGAREIAIEVDPEWIVANVSGTEVSDYDVRDEDGSRVIYLYLGKALMGRALFDIRLERTADKDSSSFALPHFKVRDAKSERGHIVLAAEEGLRLKATKISGMREVHTGSAPMRVVGAQQAFKFKEPGWSLSVDIDRTKAGIHTEIFHLVSLGEGVLYGSSMFTYHIGGAPVREFTVHIPEKYQNVEFVGRDIRNWSQDGTEWTVVLQDKVIGDYTLLATYNRQFDYDGGTISAGGVYAVGPETEMGYIALASSANLVTKSMKLGETVIHVDSDEVPDEYRAMINDPILEAFKYVKAPHVAEVKLGRLETERLLTQVIDHAMITTRVSEDGDGVTTIIYSVKNASAQYLVVKLPKGVTRPWSTRVIDETGNWSDVRSQQKIDEATGITEVLIPIRRPRDVSRPIQVELVYPETHGLTELGGTMKLQSPVTPSAHSTFVKWMVEVPSHLVITDVDGAMQMSQDSERWNTRRTMNAARMVLRGVATCIRNPRKVLSRSALRQFAQYGQADVDNKVALTETMALVGADPLELTVDVAPAWVGPGGSIATMGILGLLGVVVTAYGFRKKARNRLMMALGLTGLVFAVAQTAAGRMALVPSLYLLVILLALWLVIKIRVFPFIFNTIKVILRTIKSVARYAWTALKEHRERRSARRAAAREAARERATAMMEEAPFQRSEVGDQTSEEEEESNSQRPASAKASAGKPTPNVQRPSMKIEKEAAEEDQGDVDEDDPEHRTPNTGHSGDGFTRTTMLVALAGLCLAAACAFAETKVQVINRATGPQRDLLAQRILQQPNVNSRPMSIIAQPANWPVVMDSVDIKIAGPGSDRDEERSATVTETLVFTTEKDNVSMTIIESPGVLVDYDLGSRYASIRASKSGYILNLEKDDDYTIKLTYLVPVFETEGTWSVGLRIPSNMKNTISLTLPEVGMDIQCDESVHLTRTETTNSTSAMAVFGSATRALFTWRPRIRKTTLEEAVYFCEVNTFASCDPGVVEATHVINYQIAQGELKRLAVKVPAGMNITAVRAKDLSTWRFDPDHSLLEAVLESPVAGRCTLVVTAQVTLEGGDKGAYAAVVGAVTVEGAARQRGSIAIASPETMQVRVDNTDGLHAMNIVDFSAEAVASAHSQGHAIKRQIKRAFRYDQLPVSASIEAEPVLPEIRVDQQNTTLDISDERVVLSSTLMLTVSKAGIFSAKLDIPRDFDIESLTGDDISHWDDVEGSGGRVVVHFKNKALGERRINLVIAKMEKGIESRIEIPRITVLGARKHTGTLVVSGEQGVRMTTVERQGVSELSPLRDLQRRERGLLAFKILRTDWKIVLNTEVISPTIKPEVLQRVDLMEGMLRGKAHIVYQVENAGCKSFKIRSPHPGIILGFAGDQIAKAYEIDKSNGVWQVDLHNKQLGEYSLEVSYQTPFDPKAGKAVIEPVGTIDTSPQKGYLVIMSGGRVQVSPEADSLAGLKPEDSRSIPTMFNAGDMSDAIYCYRTVRADYQLALSVVRHDSARVLPARVQDVQMTTVVADNRGQLMTRCVLRLDVGDLRFLKVNLPDKKDELWTVFVNGQVVEPAMDGDAHRIPLEEVSPEELTTVDFVYAGESATHGFSRQEFHGPTFNLPLNNINWAFYIRPDKRYCMFDGNMKFQAQTEDAVVFDERHYTIDNLRQLKENQDRAKLELQRGEEFARKGDPKRAQKAFQQAMDLAQNQADREDARIQYHNMLKQQTMVGLVQRRNKMRLQQNIRDEQQMEQLRGYNDGNYTKDYAQSVQRSLSSEENAAFSMQTERIIEQQAAAAGIAQAIKITMPEHGRRLDFFRPIQTDPTEAVVIEFSALGSGATSRAMQFIMPLLVLVIMLRLAVGRVVKA